MCCRDARINSATAIQVLGNQDTFYGISIEISGSGGTMDDDRKRPANIWR